MEDVVEEYQHTLGWGVFASTNKQSLGIGNSILKAKKTSAVAKVVTDLSVPINKLFPNYVIIQDYNCRFLMKLQQCFPQI